VLVEAEVNDIRRSYSTIWNSVLKQRESIKKQRILEMHFKLGFGMAMEKSVSLLPKFLGSRQL